MHGPPRGAAADARSTGSADGTTDSHLRPPSTDGRLARSSPPTPTRSRTAGCGSRYAAAAPFQVMAPGYLPEGYAYVDRNPVTAGAYDIDGRRRDQDGHQDGLPADPGGRSHRPVPGHHGDHLARAPAAARAGRSSTTASPTPSWEPIRASITSGGSRTIRLYWVSNTLSYYLSTKELLKVAESMIVDTERQSTQLNEKPYTRLRRRRAYPRGRWKRIVLWRLGRSVVICCWLSRGGSYLWFRTRWLRPTSGCTGEVKTVLDRASPAARIVSAHRSTVPESPSAMNILVLGSDRRPTNEDETYGRSDTIILVHIDPDNDYLSVLSLPRDLRVDVPGHGQREAQLRLRLRRAGSHHQDGRAAHRRRHQPLPGGRLRGLQRHHRLPGRGLRRRRPALLQRQPELRADRALRATSSSTATMLSTTCASGTTCNMDFGRMERQQRFLTRHPRAGHGLGPALQAAQADRRPVQQRDHRSRRQRHPQAGLWGIRLDGTASGRSALIGRHRDHRRGLVRALPTSRPSPKR